MSLLYKFQIYFIDYSDNYINLLITIKIEEFCKIRQISTIIKSKHSCLHNNIGSFRIKGCETYFDPKPSTGATPQTPDIAEICPAKNKLIAGIEWESREIYVKKSIFVYKFKK